MKVKVSSNKIVVKNALEQQKKAILLTWGTILQKEAVLKITENKSVITGNLRASIDFATDNKSTVSVGTNVIYGPTVEYYKPFIEPAVARSIPQLEDVASKILKGE